MISDALPKIRGAKLIIAHMGGHGYLEDCKKYLAGKNIWFDTSSMNLNSEKTLNKVRDIILNHDENKILFGSDTPWFDQGESIEYIKQMNLGQGIEEKVFFENAAKILNI
jgi:predicted TIM-barrel fold metal-dependent hydrolase